MAFNLEAALAATTRILAERSKTKTLAYQLFYSNDTKRYEGKITGFTIKQLVNEFRATKGSFKYAFITPIGNEEKIVRFYNSSVSKKFFSATRTGGKRVKKTV